MSGDSNHLASSAVARLMTKRSGEISIPSRALEKAGVSAKVGYVARIKEYPAAAAYDASKPKVRLYMKLLCGAFGLLSGSAVTPIMGLVAASSAGARGVGILAFYGGPASIVVGSLTAALFGVAIPLSAVVSMLRKDRRRYPLYRRLEADALNSWLGERYGVEISPEVLTELVTLVHKQAGDTCEFEDVHGTKLKMVSSPEHGWLVVENANTRGLHDYQPAGSIAQLEAEATVAERFQEPAEKMLRGEAPVLHEGYQTLLRTVRNLDLTPEQAHVVKRVQQDMAATLALLRKAVLLGGPDAEQQAEIVQIIAELIEELQGLTGEHRAEVTRSLRVQRTYVVQRRQPAGSLALTADQQEIEVNSSSGSAKLSSEPEEVSA